MSRQSQNNKYQTYLGSEEWNKIKKKALQRADFKCQLCGCPRSYRKLHAHHNSYENVYNEKLEDIIILCADCHEAFHKTSGLYQIESRYCLNCGESICISGNGYISWDYTKCNSCWAIGLWGELGLHEFIDSKEKAQLPNIDFCLWAGRRCKGVKKNGERCKNITSHDEDYCHVHSNTSIKEEENNE